MDLPTPATPLRIGTRGSPLALAQAAEARDRLADAFGLAGEAFEIVVIATKGDLVLDRPLKDIGGKGLFTREIEEDLLSGSIDIAVHSMKDMPVRQPVGLLLDTHLPREDARDAFLSRACRGIQDLPEGAVVGSSSLRRRAQLAARRRDLRFVEFRGNVRTRLEKLEAGAAEATLLACAGLNRLGVKDAPARPVETDELLPAVAQGAIGIERRADDSRAARMLEAVNDAETNAALAAERAYLAALDGSCETPIAGHAVLDGGTLTLTGEILRPDGSEVICDSVPGAAEDGAAIGRELALRLLGRASEGFFDWRRI